jgi:hypothetical protein
MTASDEAQCEGTRQANGKPSNQPKATEVEGIQECSQPRHESAPVLRNECSRERRTEQEIVTAYQQKQYTYLRVVKVYGTFVNHGRLRVVLATRDNEARPAMSGNIIPVPTLS